ncbi:tRNA lysidine(34) synthetase TilS [candidate division WOR-1 bacterium RIFCSPHIGHO2_01_FULL_53_15]|uniref:tRNA(Ile)-lysidine synthase n=1 Tax=candidate division WOR-1 bacterium RIFCSPHIGHO2_01_FULL_53_15 TaxID=1802564 RepID=A0A1F4Q2E3_UNCSA|nr:MAG: tRNA lysidine(34) synthetase TilS [candidate division WOR-1 bacterium RIFCSPHIGHO2_01_FULL_53_15]OGC13212.1 MAG: tRNA lysidine(34) synthetase TilS [candidate division WOR-1 bacterium RIFCSPHIGHO2_02_FULL_53_26]
MIEKKLLETIKEFRLLEPGDKVLVAVSGGVDSTALLNLLFSIHDGAKFSLHIAHLNHMLRKGDADLDVRFVEGLAQKLGLPITVEAVDVAALARKEKLGIEEAARQARYEFFERTAEKVEANKIAVAHTADDNIETFLMRLLRGAGLKGLCGIPPKRGVIVRPLIRVWRREIEDYVGALKLVPRRDHTNYESKYMRNSVRLKLVPQLKIYNLNIKEIILQTILLLTEDSLYLENKAAEALAEVKLEQTAAEIKLSLPRLRKIESAIQGHLLRLAIEKVKGDLFQLSFGHIRGLLEKLDAAEKWEMHLPGGVFAAGQREVLSISREKSAAVACREFRYTLKVPGQVDLPEIGCVFACGFADKIERSDDRSVAYIDYAALGKEIIVRNKLPGDRFAPLGVMGTKKLQDFFVDEKIPAEEREAVPVVESGGQIVWVGGWRVDDRAKVTDKTRRIVRLELK